MTTLTEKVAAPEGGEMTAEFSLIRWQEQVAERIARFDRMGRRGAFQTRLTIRKAERELVALGYTDLQAYAIVRDACDAAELAGVVG